MAKTSTNALLLLFAAMAWGSGFAVTKGALDQISPYLIMVLRFGIAALVMLPFIYKRLRTIPTKTWRIGLLIGFFAWAGHLFQFLGMQHITAGESAFLSAVYVVLVPLIVWGLRGARPTTRHLAACFLCLVGVGIISLDRNLTMGTGVCLTLLGGLGFALQIACISRYAADCDMIVITWITVVVSSLCSCPMFLLVNGQVNFISAKDMLSLVYLAVVCSVLAFSAQYTGLEHVPPALASILLSMESVFGSLAGVLFLQETINSKMLIGCILILASLLLCSMPKKSIVLKDKRRKQHD